LNGGFTPTNLGGPCRGTVWDPAAGQPADAPAVGYMEGCAGGGGGGDWRDAAMPFGKEPNRCGRTAAGHTKCCDVIGTNFSFAEKQPDLLTRMTMGFPHFGVPLTSRGRRVCGPPWCGSRSRCGLGSAAARRSRRGGGRRCGPRGPRKRVPFRRRRPAAGQPPDPVRRAFPQSDHRIPLRLWVGRGVVFWTWTLKEGLGRKEPAAGPGAANGGSAEAAKPLLA